MTGDNDLAATSDQGDAVTVQFLGTKQLPEPDAHFRSATYIEYSFKIEPPPNGLDARVGRDGHMFRTRYSKARAAHAEILQSASPAFSGQSNELVAFPASFPLRDMTTDESLKERGEELRVYYQELLLVDGALAMAEVRRAVSLDPADEAAVLTAAGLYFDSVGPLKARFAELCTLHWGDDEGLRAPLPLARALGIEVLRQSRRDVDEQCSSAAMMPPPQSEATTSTTTSDDLERCVDTSLTAVVMAEQGLSGDLIVVDWASFESWWKAECLEPIASAARRALLPLEGMDDPEKEAVVVHELAREDELERSAALLSAEVQARAVALADLETLKRVVEAERSLRLEMQQQIQRSRDLGVTSSSTSSAASPPPLQPWQALGAGGPSARILPSPSNSLDAADFGGGTSGGWRGDSWVEQSAEEVDRTATDSASDRAGRPADADADAAAVGDSDAQDMPAGDGEDGDLIVVRGGRRKSKGTVAGENALARTLWQEQVLLKQNGGPATWATDGRTNETNELTDSGGGCCFTSERA